MLKNRNYKTKKAYMLILLITVKCMFNLLTEEKSYVNYESAVNPEYYERNIKPLKLAEYGIPVIHRKLGYSKGNEKVVTVLWLKKEFDKFENFLEDYLCLKKKMCNDNVNLQVILKELKNQNDLPKENFMKTVNEKEFDKINSNIIEIIEKYVDESYCFFKKLKELVNETNELLLITRYKNFNKIDELFDKLISILDIIHEYSDKCEENIK